LALLELYYTDDLTTIYRGDALAVGELDVDVDVVIADPPYSSGGRTSSERTSCSTVDKYQSSDAKKKLPAFSGDTRDQHSHAHWCALWLSACRQRTRPGGVCFVFTDWRQLAATSDALQAGGWVWRGIVVWNKPGVRPQRGRFRLDVEYAVWGSNGELPVHRVAYPSAVVTARPPRQRAHIAQKPLEVYEHILSIAPERGLVLDPFTGSGSALVAARAAGHPAIGIDLERRYCRIAAERIASAG
jgi:site-specific DNA-methyltransferase (adenine-specific)